MVTLVCGTGSPLVQIARLVRRYHVLDVDEGILAAVALQHLQRLVDQIAHVHVVLLAVVDGIAGVDCGGVEKGEIESIRMVW